MIRFPDLGSASEYLHQVLHAFVQVALLHLLHPMAQDIAKLLSLRSFQTIPSLPVILCPFAWIEKHLCSTSDLLRPIVNCLKLRVRHPIPF